MAFLFAMTVPALVLLLLVVVTIDRVMLHTRGHGIRGSATGSAGPSVSQVGFDNIAACFYAGKQVELDQRMAQAQRVDEADNGELR